MLSTQGEDPCLATYVEKLRARHEPLSRRARMRTGLHEVRSSRSPAGGAASSTSRRGPGHGGGGHGEQRG
jgi:hypothetical protein